MPEQIEIKVSVTRQELSVLEQGHCVATFSVSTGKNGVGERNGSEQTPRGQHKIRAKIGAGQPVNTVFVARRPTGEIYSPALREQYPGRDWILTRILWLSGLEPGINRLGVVDTMRRYVYIHGCPDEDKMGVPGSHGCIKMRNTDILTLFDMVPYGTRVLIEE
ncbi:L,D-transpeptidase [Thiohalophilus thiocyanatoxydans]|uniref:L,D-transpeptidase-like protein n=1 Tax=Thiohalophilus thiocyanatoxydans TaxID=381308 RepID=A0A4V3H4H0_9GAMM|nr:L,D-transpeptidase [Thiohalophilus thiocyanatoxydans]TDY02975.1 L,D-transpeptidase-like protein [Thiohalophilus thiocyanatoxydans]